MPAGITSQGEPFFAPAAKDYIDSSSFQSQLREVLQTVVHKNWNRNRNVMTIESVMIKPLESHRVESRANENPNGKQINYHAGPTPGVNLEDGNFIIKNENIDPVYVIKKNNDIDIQNVGEAILRKFRDERV